MTEIILWSSIAFVGFAYVGYPVLIWLISRCYRDPVAENLERLAFERRALHERPFLSLVIAAFREEAVIVGRVLNALLQNYPADRYEIIIGCDGDEDCTGDLVRGFEDARVRLLQFPVRRGKASVLNDCVAEARGEVIVFSDANTDMDVNALRHLARHFADPTVGGVCGKLILTDPVSGQNVDGLYWKYETFLKRCEARIGALLGVNGGIYAIRKDLYQPIPSNTIVDDFLIGMRIHLQGCQLLYDESAIAYEETPATIDSEFQRRTRIGAGGFQSLLWLRSLLNPFRGWIALTFASHKLLRWLCPAFLIVAVISNVALIGTPGYLRLLLVQELFYLVAAAEMCLFKGNLGPRWFRVPAMFVSMNAALLVGFCRWVQGIQSGTWKRTERSLSPENTVQ
jgi:cellulose synthase/poly-beta-1,6-N-acetylglucosamine synthase-like glycosyltransferase